MSTQEAFSRIANHLGNSQLAEAIEVLIEAGLAEEGIQLKGRLSRLEQQVRDGVINHDNEKVERNQIQKAIQSASKTLQSQNPTSSPSGNRILIWTAIGFLFLAATVLIGKFVLPSSTANCKFEQDLPDIKNFLIMVPSHQESLIGQIYGVLDDIQSLDTIPFDLAVDDQSFSKEKRLNRASAIQKGAACNADLISWVAARGSSNAAGKVGMHYAWLDTSTSIQWVEKIGATNTSVGSKLFDWELTLSIQSISHYFLGMSRFYQGNFAKALKDFQQVKPDTTIGEKFVLYFQGSCQRKLGEESRTKGQLKQSQAYFQQAKLSFQQAITIDQQFAEAVHDLALVYYYEDSINMARSLFEQVLTIADGRDLREKAYLNLANIAVIEKRFDEASSLLVKIRSNNQELIGFQFIQSSILIEQKRNDEALALIEHMQPQSEQDTLNWWNQKGIALESLKRDKEALVIYDRIIARFPNYANTYQNRGNLHYDNRDYKLALYDYQQALHLDSSEFDLYYLMGRCAHMIGNPSVSKNYYKKHIQRDSAHYQSSLYLAFIYQKEKNKDSAAYYYDQSFSYMPDDINRKPEFLNSAAWDLGVKLDTFEIAEKFIKKAIQIDENDSVHYGTLSELYGVHEKKELFFSTLDVALSKGYKVKIAYLTDMPYTKYYGDKRLISLIEQYPGLFPQDIPSEVFNSKILN